MKVLLVQSYLGLEEEPVFPLGLCYIATALAKHDVRIFDPNVEAEPFFRLKEHIDSFAPDVVGISLRNVRIYSRAQKRVVFYYEFLKPTIKVIREVKPDVKIVIGGPGFSMFAEQIMEREPEIDIGVFLEGDESMPELLENLQQPEQVKGLYIRKNNQVYFTEKREPPDFSILPEPRRDLIDVSKYFSSSPDAIGVLSKQGCALKCAYCIYPFLCGSRVILRSPEQVVDEIEHLVSYYKVQSIMFADPIFNIPIQHATEICEEIIRRGINIRWTAYFNEKYITEDFMSLAMKSGCYEFFFSPDTCSDKTLNLLKKHLAEKDILKTYKLAKKLDGVKVRYNFMVFVPGENFFTLAKLARFFLKTKLFLRNKLTAFVICRPRIEPHTELYYVALREGIISETTDLIEPVFYRSPSSKYIDAILKFPSRLKRRIRS